MVNCSLKMLIQVPTHRQLSRGPETVSWRQLPRDTAGPLTPDWQAAHWGFSKACDGPSRFPVKEHRGNIIMLMLSPNKQATWLKSVQWCNTPTFSCLNLLINPSIVWKISSTFLMTWSWCVDCNRLVSSSCFCCVSSDWSVPQVSVSSLGCFDFTSSRGWGKWLAVGGSLWSSVMLSPCTVGITK